MGIGIPGELRFVLAGDRDGVEQAPGKPIGRSAGLAVTGGEQSFVATSGVGVLLIADDVVQAGTVGIAGDIIVFGALPFVEP